MELTEEQLTCPITQRIFAIPVALDDGNLYERSAIEGWLEKHQTSPLTRARVTSKPVPVRLVSQLLKEFLTAHPEKKKDQFVPPPSLQTLLEGWYPEGVISISSWKYGDVMDLFKRAIDPALCDHLDWDTLVVDNDGDYFCLPHMALYFGTPALLDYLVTLPLNWEVEDHSGQTPLHYLIRLHAKKGRFTRSQFQQLLQHPLKLDDPEKGGHYLHTALSLNLWEWADDLIKAGSPLTFPKEPLAPHYGFVWVTRGQHLETVCPRSFFGSAEPDLEPLRRLLSLDLDHHRKNSTGSTMWEIWARNYREPARFEDLKACWDMIRETVDFTQEEVLEMIKIALRKEQTQMLTYWDEVSPLSFPQSKKWVNLFHNLFLSSNLRSPPSKMEEIADLLWDRGVDPVARNASGKSVLHELESMRYRHNQSQHPDISPWIYRVMCWYQKKGLDLNLPDAEGKSMLTRSLQAIIIEFKTTFTFRSLTNTLSYFDHLFHRDLRLSPVIPEAPWSVANCLVTMIRRVQDPNIRRYIQSKPNHGKMLAVLKMKIARLYQSLNDIQDQIPISVWLNSPTPTSKSLLENIFHLRHPQQCFFQKPLWMRSPQLSTSLSQSWDKMTVLGSFLTLPIMHQDLEAIIHGLEQGYSLEIPNSVGLTPWMIWAGIWCQEVENYHSATQDEMVTWPRYPDHLSNWEQIRWVKSNIFFTFLTVHSSFHHDPHQMYPRLVYHGILRPWVARVRQPLNDPLLRDLLQTRRKIGHLLIQLQQTELVHDRPPQPWIQLSLSSAHWEPVETAPLPAPDQMNLFITLPTTCPMTLPVSLATWNPQLYSSLAKMEETVTQLEWQNRPEPTPLFGELESDSEEEPDDETASTGAVVSGASPSRRWRWHDPWAHREKAKSEVIPEKAEKKSPPGEMCDSEGNYLGYNSLESSDESEAESEADSDGDDDSITAEELGRQLQESARQLYVRRQEEEQIFGSKFGRSEERYITDLLSDDEDDDDLPELRLNPVAPEVIVEEEPSDVSIANRLRNIMNQSRLEARVREALGAGAVIPETVHLGYPRWNLHPAFFQ